MWFFSKAPYGKHSSGIPFIKLPLIKVDFANRRDRNIIIQTAFDFYVQNRIKSIGFSSFQKCAVFLLKLPDWQINSITYPQGGFLWKSVLLQCLAKWSYVRAKPQRIGPLEVWSALVSVFFSVHKPLPRIPRCSHLRRTYFYRIPRRWPDLQIPFVCFHVLHTQVLKWHESRGYVWENHHIY